MKEKADLRRWIAEAAYYRAQSRGFEAGGETEDWLAAEAEILARLRSVDTSEQPLIKVAHDRSQERL